MISSEEILGRTRERGVGDAPRLGLWQMGFRPFFILAAVAAVALVPLRVAALLTDIPLRHLFLAPHWHAHEMVFGYAVAVIAGFLLTAVPKWTKTPPRRGPTLIALSGLWLVGRLAPLLTDFLPQEVIGGAQLLFLPALIWAVGAPILRTGNRRNYAILLILTALWLADVASLSRTLRYPIVNAVIPLRAAVYAIGVLMVIIGGRIIPPFTRNGLSSAGISFQPRANDLRDILAPVAAALVVIAEAASAPGVLTAALAALAAALVASRMLGWGTFKTARVPLLWVLHAGYLWLPAAYALLAVAHLDPTVLNPRIALHAMTAGAMGTLILAMISRVALGHTGRPLKAPGLIIIAYVAVILAGLVRVGMGFVGTDTFAIGWSVSAGLWMLAYGLYLWVFLPILVKPRADGRPG